MNSACTPIAIVGMSCIFPGAPTIKRFWQNIINGVDSIRPANNDEWDGQFYKNKARSSFGHIYCNSGGFITEYSEFDPLEFGIMPASLKGSDPDQFLALRAASEALADAGYNHKNFDGERADIILGRTSAPGIGSMNLIQHGQTLDQIMSVLSAVATNLSREQLNAIREKLRSDLQQCNPDTIPAVMPNVLSGRIANKLGFRGRNLILDAACASSLSAVEIAMQGLISQQSDLAIAGGVHINSSPYFYQMFCELGALSESGKIRPFDDNADGTILGEGVGMVVLKRLDDALRDKNKIYAVIKGIGSSSDGRSGGNLAPNVDGEALAMRRAYQMAGVSPATVELLEAHGTATRAGDLTEMKSIQQVFGADRGNQQKPWCAIGSVKSNIGHTQAASGIAGLIKTALALHQQLLPPTLNVAKPNSQINWDESPCYVNTAAKQWLRNESQKSNKDPRRAAVSAFGFGGVNAHAVLEEYTGAEGAESPQIPDLDEPAQANQKRMVKLSLRYPEFSAKGLEEFAQTPIKGVQLNADTFAKREPSSPGAGALTEDSSFRSQATEYARELILNSEGMADSSQKTIHPARPLQGKSQIPIVRKQSREQGKEHISVAEAASEPKNTNDSNQTAVLNAYIQSVGEFHKNLLSVQESVMLSYLNTDEITTEPES